VVGQEELVMRLLMPLRAGGVLKLVFIFLGILGLVNRFAKLEAAYYSFL